jgi:cob(I)alamin adenosyltransferase
MSIITKTGDDGTTGLMYNRRLSKADPRIEACGSVDELNAALGMARAASAQPLLRQRLAGVQKDLVLLMGELAICPQDLARYVKDGFSVVTPEMTANLERWALELESQLPPFKGFAIAGQNLASATLDAARTVCRRAERRVCTLQESGQLANGQIIVFLNRLSDTLWLLARSAEGASTPS